LFCFFCGRDKEESVIISKGLVHRRHHHHVHSLRFRTKKKKKTRKEKPKWIERKRIVKGKKNISRLVESAAGRTVLSGSH
jgi:acid phosphatase class B